MILTLVAADGVDLGDTARVAKLGPDDPVLKRAQVFGRIGLAVGTSCTLLGLDRIQEDLPEAGGDRAKFRGDAGGKLTEGALEALIHQLACEIDVGAVVEDDGHLAQPVSRNRAGVLKARNACDGGLDGEGDALFGLQRRIAGGFGVDLNLDVGDVRSGVDRQALEAPDADGAGQEDEPHDRPSEADRKGDDTFKHGDRAP